MKENVKKSKFDILIKEAANKYIKDDINGSKNLHRTIKKNSKKIKK